MRHQWIGVLPGLTVIAVAVAGVAVSLGQPTGGFLDNVNPPGDRKGPDHSDAPPPRPRPPRVPAPAGPSKGDADLEATIAAARETVERLRTMEADKIPPVQSVEDAERIVQHYRRLAEQLGPDLEAGDRAAAAALKQKTEAFEEKYKNRREAIESGQRPEGVSAAAFARVRDEYFAEREVLTAEATAMQQRLRRRQAAPSAAAERLRIAEGALETVRANGGKVTPELRQRLHEARIALAERKLKELEQVKQERAGQESGRSNASTASTVITTGDWYIDTMDWLARAMATANSGPPPADLPPGAGLPLPGGEAGTKIGPRKAQEAKVRWTARRVTLLRQELEGAEAAMVADDAEQLKDYENDLREQERLLDPLDRPAQGLKRIQALDALKAEQEKTRPARLEEYRARLRREIESWGEVLTKEQAELAKMPPDPPPPPAPAPSPETKGKDKGK